MTADPNKEGKIVFKGWPDTLVDKIWETDGKKILMKWRNKILIWCHFFQTADGTKAQTTFTDQIALRLRKKTEVKI